jgi:two-component system sensor kinase FixL
MQRVDQARSGPSRFSHFARRAVIGIISISAALLIIDVFFQQHIIDRLGEKAWSFVAFAVLGCFILYLGHKAPVSRGVRRTLVFIVTMLMVDVGIDVTQEMDSLERVPVIGRTSDLGALMQDGVEAARVCAMSFLLYLLLKSIDETQARYRRNMDELAHVSRRNTMGELAAGLAHELNQPLAAIANYAHAASAKIEGADSKLIDPLRQLLEKIESQSCRAGDIIKRLRRTLAPSEPEFSSVDLSTVVNDAVDACAARATQLRQCIRVHYARGLTRVRADAVQVQQVIVNLIVNALEANAASERLDTCVSIVTAPLDDDWIDVSVSDRGGGLAPEVVTRVFEPFFTTKDEGLGFGLAISKSIAEVHQGRLTARNNADDGATFSLQLSVRGPASPTGFERSIEQATTKRFVA